MSYAMLGRAGRGATPLDADLSLCLHVGSDAKVRTGHAFHFTLGALALLAFLGGAILVIRGEYLQKHDPTRHATGGTLVVVGLTIAAVSACSLMYLLFGCNHLFKVLLRRRLDGRTDALFDLRSRASRRALFVMVKDPTTFHVKKSPPADVAL